MAMKSKYIKKKPGKFNKKKPQDGKPKVHKTVQEDEDIKKLQEAYEKLPDIKDIKSFDNFPLSKKTRKGLLANKFRVPTEIQKQSIGLALQGKDVLGAAQTGSGKTLGKLNNFLELPQLISLISSISDSDSRKPVSQKVDTNRWRRRNHHLSDERTRISNFRDTEESWRLPRIFERFDYRRKKFKVRENANGSVQHRDLHTRSSVAAHGRKSSV